MRRAARDVVTYRRRACDFIVHGTDEFAGLVTLEHTVALERAVRRVSSPALPVSPAARDVRGPSAFGGGWRRFADLTWMIGATEYRLTYFGSALGYLWSLVRPLMLFGVLYVVFSQIVNFGEDIPNYPVLLLLNIVLFNFFPEATQRR